VPTRREQILDAAIAVLGRQGVRALTHRAVDAAAALPQGSTSNYFRTRDALFGGVVERVSERERAGFDELAAAAAPTTPAELAGVLAAAARVATRENRELTLSRFAILVEAGIHPQLRRKLGEVAADVRAWATDWLRAVGSLHPERDMAYLGNYVDARVLHQLAQPDPAFDPESELVELVIALVGPDQAGADRVSARRGSRPAGRPRPAAR
jgi:DNA-binding transcriptional regulator YbjK